MTPEPPVGTSGTTPATTPAEDDRAARIGITIPSFFTAIAKSGAWAVLAFWLVYSLLLQRQNSDSSVASNVAQNGQLITGVATKMDQAAVTMHAYVLDQQRSQERVLVMLIEVCVQQAEALKLPGGTQRCFDAARGIGPDREHRAKLPGPRPAPPPQLAVAKLPKEATP